MKNNTFIVSFIGLCALLVAALVFGGTFHFLCGYLGGWLLKCFVGDPVTSGLNMILANITQHTFTPEDIPLFCAIMTTIGGFFTTHISKNKE
jgi:hypothetical protein